jgi:hypothetical protein
MGRFYRGRYAPAVCVAAAMLAGCGGSSLGSNGAGPLGSSADVVRPGSGSNTCYGSGGASVSPCPVTLTYEGQQVIVQVSAPNISYATRNAKQCRVPNGGHGPVRHYCHVVPYNGKGDFFAVSPGKVCGGSEGSVGVRFVARGPKGRFIGSVGLPITNQSC